MLKLIEGDITKITADAIVNAANTSLMGGGGVDGAIHRAGGPEILEACRKIVAKQGGCRTGEAVITTGGKLPAKYVIHTVGSVWNGGLKNERSLLRHAYRNSLQLCVTHQLQSVAFPNISTGIYGFPKEEAATIALETVTSFINGNQYPATITFVCFDEDNFRIYTEVGKQLNIVFG